MRTLGIDLASQPAATAACLVAWEPDRARVETLEIGCDDARLDALVRAAGVIGVDAPFGWPAPFAAAVAGWSRPEWTPAVRDELRFRETDRRVRTLTGRWPLSVSTDLIALPAMRAMALLRRHGATDRSGDGRFYEVYPSASLRIWGLESGGHRGSGRAGHQARMTLLARLRERFPWLECPDLAAAEPDLIDALLASLTARCAATGTTEAPPPPVRDLARSEGWIHLPTAPPSPGGASPHP